MKKVQLFKIMTLIGIVLLLGGLLFYATDCSSQKSKVHSFYGKVIASDTLYIIVEPDELEQERKSSDKFSVSLETNDIHYEIGSKVKITYDGNILESYPAQIKPIKIELIDN